MLKKLINETLQKVKIDENVIYELEEPISDMLNEFNLKENLCISYRRIDFIQSIICCEKEAIMKYNILVEIVNKFKGITANDIDDDFDRLFYRYVKAQIQMHNYFQSDLSILDEVVLNNEIVSEIDYYLYGFNLDFKWNNKCYDAYEILSFLNEDTDRVLMAFTENTIIPCDDFSKCYSANLPSDKLLTEFRKAIYEKISIEDCDEYREYIDSKIFKLLGFIYNIILSNKLK